MAVDTKVIERVITIQAPPPQKEREPVGVGAQGESAEADGSEGRSLPERSGDGDLPEDPEVLPDVPDAPADKRRITTRRPFAWRVGTPSARQWWTLPRLTCRSRTRR